MNNKEVFIDNLNQCGEVRYEVSEIHSRIISKIKDVYKIVFGREKCDFSNLKNMMYFKGGVETPDSRPRLHEKLDEFINLVNHYEFLGDEEIKGYLKEHGISLGVEKKQIEDGPIVVLKEDTKNFERAWEFIFGTEHVPATKKEILNRIIDRSVEVQKTIENKKDEISEKADNVDSSCQIKKPFFMKAIQIKVKELKKRSVDNEIVKIESDIESSKEIISVFDHTTESGLKQ